ncbi:relaxase [Escherichia coli]|uniref:relaxase n=1 Tax=Escherichia coli TaxID=562 RepID=UPI00388E676A
MAGQSLSVGFRPFPQTTPTRATAHERTPQQERQKAARGRARPCREAWTLGQGMKKPVAGCYGRLTRWKGGGDVVYMALL